MNNAEFQLRAVGDPRLAAHAASALPAWLWSIDGAAWTTVATELFLTAGCAMALWTTHGRVRRSMQQKAVNGTRSTRRRCRALQRRLSR